MEEEKWTINETIILLELITKIVIIMTIATLILTKWICSFTVVEGESMMPNIKNNERLLLDHITYKIGNDIDRYDIVVFKPKFDKCCYIKRVIGLPGETIRIEPTLYNLHGSVEKKYAIYINNKKLTDDIYHLENELYNGTNGTITLAEDEYFVLGDNRNNSEDSRSDLVGKVNISTIEGVVIAKK